MRVLVTGGEGLVGTAVVDHLRAHGHDVTLLRGDARDRAAVAEAAECVDGVAHLAAIPSPFHHPADEVFGNNALATFTVLWTAAELGVRRFVVAGSVNATGLIMNPHAPPPARYPIDETAPADVADPYSLSKQVDELTLRAVCRRFGAAGFALRLPLMISEANRAGLRAWAAENAASGRGDGWGWLDVRDGAEAFRLALTVPCDGAQVVHVAATTTFQDAPTEELLARHAPKVPRTERFPGRTAPIDTTRARELLGFTPRHGED
ncbi:UDP-glucose 4-epimerase [Asanoa ishikariensis]|uniref:Nucleoside-diphosphate-sugar epimerase n=1 Tax=Asanoa ishikariensis TaxID=137265 RepID=A0A1H3UHI7_9ACTN|nr:NAD(P)-dependent oxidoreductase [Asanoa ishikariensis]GIF63489.1 UDP-glucose 4-epimerase [Asanoa ishikariensis]SDZ61962.1 Nucleoside-diphosphate-sugar epimerase [Asanoa ishikariensis]